MLWLGVFAVAARSFGGFSAADDRYLAGNLVCEPLAAEKDGKVAGKPSCVEMDRPAQKALGFVKPARGRETPDGRYRLAASVEDGQLKLVAIDGGRERLLARWAPGGAVTSVNMGLFVSPRGLVAVEYRVGDAQDVVAFDVRAPLGGAKEAEAGAKGDRTVYERVLAKGGVWEQRQRPCEQAGVHLALTRDRKFDLRIESKCQGQKDVTRLSGGWLPEGKGGIVLTFPNQEGPEEKLPCQLDACPDAPGEECLSCADEDVTFMLYVVRR